MSKIDRVLGNHQWEEAYPNVEVTFHPKGDSDYTPIVVCFFNPINSRKPFKFYNHWGKDPEFADTVSRIWSTKIHRYLNFQILTKMQLLKHALKAKFSKAHIEDQLRQPEHQLSVRQNQMHSDPLNPMYAVHEQKATENLRKVKDDYAS